MKISRLTTETPEQHPRKFPLKRRPKCFIVYSTDALHQAGGIQKVICALSSGLFDKGWDVTLVTEQRQSKPPFYPINPNVHLVNIAPSISFLFSKSIRKRLMRYFYPALLKQEKPDIVLCTSWNDLERLPKGYPTVLMQHAPPRITLKKTKRPSVQKRYLKLLKQTACVQVLCPSFMDDFHQFCPSIPLTCIGNPVPLISPTLRTNPPSLPSLSQHPTILCAGRFEPNKNQLLLIQAFIQVHAHCPTARLWLYGDAHDPTYTAQCQAIAAASPARDHIFFHPAVSDLSQVYQQADIYASPSLFEGWGLTITEAMSHGIPVIGLKSSDGINSLIRHNRTGLLTESSATSLANGLLFFIQNPHYAQDLARQAKTFIQQFSPDSIFTKWDTLLRHLLSSKTP